MSTETEENHQLAERRPWNAIRHWAYWLDGPKIQQLATSAFDLLVIDYSRDGSAEGAFSKQEITSLRSSFPARRVVAYLSIGQAESYRGYWQQHWNKQPPHWLAYADPDWEENYWVHYWEPDWQQFIFQYLDAIIAAGFDGIYLDRIDAYEESYANAHEQEMVDFVLAIAHYARSHSSLGEDFGIFVQNAEELATHHVDYVKCVTGIAREELYVAATNHPTTQRERTRGERGLNIFLRQQKLVLTVDYANRPDLIDQTYHTARQKGYRPYVTTVDLNELRLNDGYDPQ